MINLRKANFIYNFKINKHFEEVKNKKELLKTKPYLANCNFFDRYPNTSSIFSLDTLFIIGYKDLGIDKKLKYSLEKSQLLAYFIGKLFKGKLSFSSVNLLSLLFSFLKYSLRLFASITDLILTITYSFYYINFIKDDSVLRKLNSKKNKIYLYTYTYWKTKSLSSVNYYYPDLKLNKNNYFKTKHI